MQDPKPIITIIPGAGDILGAGTEDIVLTGAGTAAGAGVLDCPGVGADHSAGAGEALLAGVIPIGVATGVVTMIPTGAVTMGTRTGEVVTGVTVTELPTEEVVPAEALLEVRG